MEAGVINSSTPLVVTLSNSLVLRQIAPYLRLSEKVKLAATCSILYSLLSHSPDAFRYVDLKWTKAADVPDATVDRGGVSWRSERMDESFTEDDFYCGPLRGILSRFQRRGVLNHIHTLILDGLTVPADLVREIICEDRFNVRTLSIREAKHLNERKLKQVLEYAVRPSRPEGTPKLKALYFFGPQDTERFGDSVFSLPNSSELLFRDAGVMRSQGAQIGAEWNRRSLEALESRASSELMWAADWYSPHGRMLRRITHIDWAETIKACEGIIAFDAVLCRGPRHDPRAVLRESAGNPQVALGKVMSYIKPEIATIALGPSGCESCHSAPEGVAVFSMAKLSDLPLLSPPPLHASTVRAGQQPFTKGDFSAFKLIARCEDCLESRWCERCNAWWCEDCYVEPTSRFKSNQNASSAHENSAMESDGTVVKSNANIKVHMGLCVEHCLVGEMMSGAGSNGMWA
jgi:hypothetical protein